MNLQAQRLFRQKLIEHNDRAFDLEQELRMLKINAPLVPCTNEASTATEPIDETCSIRADTDFKVLVASSCQTILLSNVDASTETEVCTETCSVSAETDSKVLNESFSQTDNLSGGSAATGFSLQRFNFWRFLGK